MWDSDTSLVEGSFGPDFRQLCCPIGRFIAGQVQAWKAAESEEHGQNATNLGADNHEDAAILSIACPFERIKKHNERKSCLSKQASTRCCQTLCARTP
eukprot:scaffold1638_cov258-Pinguiococcus_pyrenoidosus.AAC.60